MAIPRVPATSGRRGRWRFAAIATACMGMATEPARGQDPPPPDPTSVGQDSASQGAPATGSGQGTEADASGGQVLTQGPVHEAFATPLIHDPKAAPRVSKPPPDPIKEMPPDQKPAGQNIQWISGYWAWDTTRNDFLWVSGVWREPPPGTQWLPGYWHTVAGGYQWAPGVWMPTSTGPSAGAVQSAAQSPATYLPPPPHSLEAGPNSPRPGPNTVWNPGYWFWEGGGYAWRPGFWFAVQPNWVWMPPHYVWTPTGFLFVPGYWDLPVTNRGLMFAPVYYPQPVYAQPGFVYTPSIGIVGSAVTSNLFVSVGTGQYMFGNYYAQSFASVGIVPWFSFNFAVGRPVYYDPLFSYYAVVNVRQNPQWVLQVREAYRMRAADVRLRPPVTYAEQVRITRNVSITRDVTVVDHRNMAMPLRQLARDPIAGRTLRLERVAEAERRTIQRQATELRQLRAERAQLERQAARSGPSNQPRRTTLPRSPVASYPASRPAGHPGGHPAAHNGADGPRAAMARREEIARGRSFESSGRARLGAAESRPAMPERRSENPVTGRRPISGGQGARPGSRQSAGRAAASRGRVQSDPERKPERRPEH